MFYICDKLLIMGNLINLIGIPLDLGAENLGVDIGPQAFRYQHIAKKLSSAGLEVKDHGDITVSARKDIEVGDERLRYADEIIRVNQEVAKLTDTIISSGQKIVALGGDHSINLGLISGASTALKQDLVMIYLDAHGDMNTKDTTLSGNIHGMHVASLLGLGDERLSNLYSQGQKLNPNNLLHIGGSDWDPAELDLVSRLNIKTFTLFDLLSNNLAPLLKLIDEVALISNNVWVSLDLDVIDQIYAPGAGMPNAKGLTYREIATIAEYIGQKCRVIGVDVVEYNPLQDVNYKTADLGIELIAKFLGQNLSWYTGYMERNKINA